MWQPIFEGATMNKLWKLKADDSEANSKLAGELNISKFLAGLLIHRGINDFDEARNFLYIEEMPFHDPFLMKDMDKAVSRISSAIDNKEKIVIYGDYDVDGITATSLMVKNLRKMGADVEYYIPDRQSEGYGFNDDALERLWQSGTDLLVSVDCGISAINEVETVREKMAAHPDEPVMDIIITDHHTPGGVLPDAVAVVNPHRQDDDYPFEDLCGAGVAYKLCQALYKARENKDFQDDLDIAALGTVADIVPLRDENRKLVKMGLRAIENTDNIGIRALVEISGLTGKKIGAGHIGFMLAPRLNAAGRMMSASSGVKLLLSTDSEAASQIAQELDDINTVRKETENDIFELAKAQIDENGYGERPAIVVAGEGWHPGVIGIVASKIVEEYYRPTVVIGIKDGIAKGSCRSIAGMNIYDALQACKDELLGFGGHAMAAGLSLAPDKIDSFRKKLEDYASGVLTSEDYVPVVDVESELMPENITLDMVAEIEKLEPFGMGNPGPVFCAHSIRGSYARRRGRDGQHLVFKVDSLDGSVDVVGWNMGDLSDEVNRQNVDILFVPEKNEWNGRITAQCNLKDLVICKKPLLCRDVMKEIYIHIMKTAGKNGVVPYGLDELFHMLNRKGTNMNFDAFEAGIKVLLELNLLIEKIDGFEMVPTHGSKMNLSDSATFRKESE